MTTTTTFTKGDLVTKIGAWNNRGTFAIQHAEVYACGKKKMVLNKVGSDVCLGRDYLPAVKQYGNQSVFPLMTNEEAEAKALEMAAEYLASEIARIDTTVTRYKEMGDNSPGYLSAMARTRAELVAATPTFIWKD